MKYLTFLIVLLCLASCGQKSKTVSENQNRSSRNNEMNNRKKYLKELIQKVGIRELPYSHDILKGVLDSKYVTKLNSVDTIFFENGNVWICGVLPDTSTYYCFLYFLIGDIAYPKLLTVSKEGTIIDRKDISLGVCGAPIDADTSINRFEINKDLNIKSYFKCHGTVDTNDSIPRTVEVNEIAEGTGKIARDGKIELTVREY